MEAEEIPPNKGKFLWNMAVALSAIALIAYILIYLFVKLIDYVS